MAKLKKKVDLNDLPDNYKKPCMAIIHGATLACSGAGGGMAQLPIVDNAVITPIQIAMIIALGKVFHLTLSKTKAKRLLSSLLLVKAAQIGRAATQVIIGWAPVAGNAINAATAGGVTELIGWLTVRQFVIDIGPSAFDKLSKQQTVDLSDEEIAALYSNVDSSGCADLSGDLMPLPTDRISSLINMATLFISEEKTIADNKHEYDVLIRAMERELETNNSEELIEVYKQLLAL